MRSVESFAIRTLPVMIMVLAASATYAQSPVTAGGEVLKGLAARYPGDAGIQRHPSVLFVEDFESESLEAVVRRWSWSRGQQDHRLSLDPQVERPAGSPGRQSLKMTVLRGTGGNSGDLRKILDDHHQQIHLRFYVRFAEDYGLLHHFTRVRGELNPTPHHAGGAGRRPATHFSAAIETGLNNTNHYPVRERAAPPGFWRFYVYWPEMRSWQTPAGDPDGRPNPYYGNAFTPHRPVQAKRGAWQCVEIMVRMNSAPGAKDGALALWIDGVPVGQWDGKARQPARGYWMRDTFRWDPEHSAAADFPGFNWSPLEDPDDLANYKNLIHLHHYVSSGTWNQADRYAERNPDCPIDLQEATVWKDHVVVATEYIGPLEPR